MKYIILGLLLSFNSFASTDCYPGPNGDVHCTSSDGGSVDCYPDPNGGMHCN